MYDDCTRHHLRVAKSPVHIGPLQQFAWNESRAMQRAYAMQRGWGGGDWVREADSPKPAAADQTRYTFKDLDAARAKSIAMTGADKAATQQ